MKQVYSKSWKSSTQTRKQRKYRFNAPTHIASRFLNVNLSKELRKKYEIRSIRVKKGDRVKILRGDNKKQTGKVERVDSKNAKIFVEKIEQTKKDGSKALKPISPSNLQITDLDTSDKRRFKQTKLGKAAKPAVVKAVKETKKEEKSTAAVTAKSEKPVQSEKPTTKVKTTENKVENQTQEKNNKKTDKN